MTGDLTWRSAIHADRGLLQAFTCADKPRRSVATKFQPVYAKPWAHEVQSMIRTLRPPMKAPRFMTVGVDDDGIVAVAHWTEITDELVHIEAVAVAQRAHRQGLAAELAAVVQADIVDRFTQLDREHLLVTAFVHPQNSECRKFCESAEFAVTGQTGSGYDVWSAEHYLLSF